MLSCIGDNQDENCEWCLQIVSNEPRSFSLDFPPTFIGAVTRISPLVTQTAEVVVPWH